MDVSVAANDDLRRYPQPELDGAGVERISVGVVLSSLPYLVIKKCDHFLLQR